jgi:hypothetical protein
VREKRNLEIVDAVSQQQKFHQLQSAGDLSFWVTNPSFDGVQNGDQ